MDTKIGEASIREHLLWLSAIFLVIVAGVLIIAEHNSQVGKERDELGESMCRSEYGSNYKFVHYDNFSDICINEKGESEYIYLNKF